MSKANSSKSAQPAKPAKPNAAFPLFAHAGGVWAKKIRGKLYYFGPWGDPDGALKAYERQAADLHAGRPPRPDPEVLTVKEAVNAYLRHKMALRDNGEITPRTWDEYKEVGDLIVAGFGKHGRVADLGPDHFAALRKRMANRWGPVRLGNMIQRVRSVFKYAHDAGLIDRPVRFGPAFDRPSAKTLRLHRAKQGPKLFTAGEIHKLLKAAEVQVKALILLGINCGFGISDCGRLPLKALDLDGGWVDFPRPKTGIPRRCPLWPETVAAIREALACRPKPKPEFADLAFPTGQGRSWAKDNMSSPLCWKISRLLKALGINGRKGIGFYTLRHTFRTVADESKDQAAVDHVMGHCRGDMASVYRERIGDDRLRAVTDHVRAWLFSAPAAK